MSQHIFCAALCACRYASQSSQALKHTGCVKFPGAKADLVIWRLACDRTLYLPESAGETRANYHFQMGNHTIVSMNLCFPLKIPRKILRSASVVLIATKHNGSDHLLVASLGRVEPLRLLCKICSNLWREDFRIHWEKNDPKTVCKVSDIVDLHCFRHLPQSKGARLKIFGKKSF